MALSFGLFVLISFSKKAIAKSRFGKYNGAVLYLGLTLSVAARVFVPNVRDAADQIAVFSALIILAVSVFENLIYF